MVRRVWLGLALAGFVLACHHDPPAPAAVRAPTFNERVLALIAEYPAQGFGGYAWPAQPGTAGTTRDLALGDAVIAHGGSGNHCVGITLEVFWRALEQCSGGIAAALDVQAAQDLKRRWYVPALGAQGAVDALVTHGLGARVPLEQAQPGDFVQAWSPDGTNGHSMIFLGADAEHIRYWSSQPWTAGIDRSESVVGEGGYARDHIYVARARCR